jgi:hypothetical protein
MIVCSFSGSNVHPISLQIFTKFYAAGPPEGTMAHDSVSYTIAFSSQQRARQVLPPGAAKK